MEPWTLGEMSEPGMANIGISEGGSSVNQYGGGEYRGLKNTKKSPEDWTTGKYTGAEENADFSHMMKGLHATLTQLDTMLQDGDDIQYFQYQGE